MKSSPASSESRRRATLRAGATLRADAACAALGISRQTLYAYVSRGFVRATADPEDPRRSLYDRRDVEALAARKRRGRSRQSVARSTLDWGEPVLTSSITQIVDGALYYRGRLATELAATETLEQVAARLIGATIRIGDPAPEPVTREPVASPGPRVTPFARMVLRAADLVAATAETGRDIAPEALLRAMAEAAAGADGPGGRSDRDTGGDGDAPVHMLLARRWGLGGMPGDAADILRRALALCADHELNASTYATRVAASAGASLQACLLAGLGTLSGPKHGGMTEICLALMRRLAGDANLRRSVRSLARRGPIPGFGHPLYPDADPRAEAMIAAGGWPAGWRRAVEIIREETGAPPSLDFALALTAEQLRLPPATGLAIFAVGRTAGWIAHAVEQRQDGRLIRPRAAAAAPPPR